MGISQSIGIDVAAMNESEFHAACRRIRYEAVAVVFTCLASDNESDNYYYEHRNDNMLHWARDDGEGEKQKKPDRYRKRDDGWKIDPHWIRGVRRAHPKALREIVCSRRNSNTLDGQMLH